MDEEPSNKKKQKTNACNCIDQINKEWFDTYENTPCEAVEQPPADHFLQIFETIRQKFQQN